MTDRGLFERAIEVVLEHEGEAFTDNPLDKGGPTKYGLSQRWNPGVNVRELTRIQAIGIYWERYWRGRGYERLPDLIAIKVFDLAVNLGERTAVTCLQRALWAIGARVRIDGRLGPETWGAAQAADEGALLAALRSEAAGEYRIRIARDPGQAVFERGWLNRAYA